MLTPVQGLPGDNSISDLDHQKGVIRVLVHAQTNTGGHIGLQTERHVDRRLPGGIKYLATTRQGKEDEDVRRRRRSIEWRRRGMGRKKREKHRERGPRIHRFAVTSISMNLSPSNLNANLSSTPFLDPDPPPYSLNDPNPDLCRSIHRSTNNKDLIPYQEPRGNGKESRTSSEEELEARGLGEVGARAVKEATARKVAKTPEPL
ncbi:hypothetical protein BHE74_00012271 [Ensete ventricosum]|nr:hypothetical protein BHE74_00012271 [Ensete ventricosum]